MAIRKSQCYQMRANALREQSHLFYESLGDRKEKTQAVLIKRVSTKRRLNIEQNR